MKRSSDHHPGHRTTPLRARVHFACPRPPSDAEPPSTAAACCTASRARWRKSARETARTSRTTRPRSPRSSPSSQSPRSAPPPHGPPPTRPSRCASAPESPAVSPSACFSRPSTAAVCGRARRRMPPRARHGRDRTRRLHHRVERPHHVRRVALRTGHPTHPRRRATGLAVGMTIAAGVRAAR